MNRIIIGILLFWVPSMLVSQETLGISGVVSDFSGHPINGATVRLMDNKFDPVTETTSDAKGHFALRAHPGHYMALVAIRDSDYTSSRLEYWAWNVPLDENLEINPRYHRLEVYAMNAFRPQGGYPSYFVYFRPMSLSMLHSGVARDSSFLSQDKLNIAPELQPRDLEVQINDEEVQILTLTRVKESGGNTLMYGYLLQCSLPVRQSSNSYDRIRIVAVDPESKDMGEGLLFVRKRN